MMRMHGLRRGFPPDDPSNCFPCEDDRRSSSPHGEALSAAAMPNPWLMNSMATQKSNITIGATGATTAEAHRTVAPWNLH